MIKLGKFYISLWTVVLVLFCAMCGALGWLALSYAALAVHELAHYIAANRLKIAHRGLVLQPFGITLRLADHCIAEPFDEILLCVAGPVANLCFAVCLWAAFDRENVYVQYLFWSNLSLAAINLLPILPLDGGRICKAYLTARLGLVRAIRITEAVTWFFVLGVGLCSVLMLWQAHFNVSLMVLVAFLLFNMSAEKSNNQYLVMRQLAEYKRKLSSRRIMPVRNLAAQTDTTAKEIAAHFSYDKYHIVHLFDESQCPVGSLTETQIVDGMMERGGGTCLGCVYCK